ncbi:endolysin [Vibrio phage vB_VcorM_GR28A]|nr:endolysin [Vibrio phage vB_VcorM_GR28A]
MTYSFVMEKNIDLMEMIKRYAPCFDKITIHCSADRPKQGKLAEDLKAGHLKKGWSDIGYHLVIERDGTLVLGRPWNRTGAHVKGQNTLNFGICLIGGLNDDTGKAEANFTDDQFNSLRYSLTTLQSILGIKDADVLGHRDRSPDIDGDGIVEEHEWLKQCPCFDVQAKLYS